MKGALYVDEDSAGLHTSSSLALTRGRRHRGFNGPSDDEQLQWSTTHARVLYSCNARDFYKLHTSLLTLGASHGGIILAPQQQYSIGEQLRRLLKLMAAKSGDDMSNQIEFLSKWG